jgi:hypothetical protein
MRLLLAVIALAAVTSCEEAVRGPRVVEYTPDRFYVRHLPWRDSRSSVQNLAAEWCDIIARQAVLEDAYQFAALDLRYATFRCVAVPAADGAV